MTDDSEADIGLVDLSWPSTSPPARPVSLSPVVSSGLKSPSLPNLLPIATRTVSRSKTNPWKHSVTAHKPSPSLDGLSMEPDKVARLHQWILSLVIVDFDLEVGPKITCVYPPLDLSLSEAENIAFSSFPDSPQFEQGSVAHSFRIRVRNHIDDELLRPTNRRLYSEDGFIYGYSYFTQRRDATSKRGYQQRSLVILSHLAYPALFYTLVTKLGPAFFLHGGPMLEAACHNIATWLNPIPGATLELGFLGAVLQAEIPQNVNTQQAESSMSSKLRNGTDNSLEHILVSVPPPDPPVLKLFGACLPQLWSIWECLVLCEPILVYAPSPAMTSQAIWWLRDILRPIPVAGDFRPFFTIHDADHAALVNARPPSSGLILGTTNPYFERACKHWPHILSLGRAPPPKADLSTTAGPLPGWKSLTHKRYTSKDQALLRQLQEACAGSEDAKREASFLLRQHFSSRTAALLVPLQRYLQSLIPPPTAVSAAFPNKQFPRSAPSSALPPTSSRFPKSASAARFSDAPSLRLTAPRPFPQSSITSSFPKSSLPGAYPTTSVSSAFPDTSSSSQFPSPQSATSDSGRPPWNAAFPPTPTLAAEHGRDRLGTNPTGSETSLAESAPSPIESASTTPEPSTEPAPTPTSAVPRLAPFSDRAFLASLKPLALPFRSSGRAKEFYTRWIRTPAFGVWLAQQEEVVERVLGRGG